MNKRTWIYASSRLWSSGARRQALLFSDKKNLPLVASPNLAIKINTTYSNFTPLCFLVLFWQLQSKIAQIQTVKIFRRSVLWMLNNLTGVPWKRGTGVSFNCSSDGSNKKFASGKIHFQFLFMWQEIHQGKCETNVLLFTSISYECKHVSDLSMLVFCFRGHTFVVYYFMNYKSPQQ